MNKHEFIKEKDDDDSNIKAFESSPDVIFNEEPPRSIYFGGAVWGCAFYVGVYRAMIERWGHSFQDKTIITGDSSGAIIAIAVALKKTPDELDEMYRTLTKNVDIIGLMGKLDKLTDVGISSFLNDPDAYKILKGRLGIATTNFPFKYFRHWSWESNDDLSDCVHGSLHIPFYCERRNLLRGKMVIDGAYSMAGTDLVHGDETLYVGIDPHAEIGRSLKTNQQLFPLRGDEYDDIVQSGYLAMKNWNGKMNAKVGFRKANFAALLVMWPLRFMEAFYDTWLIFIFFMWDMLVKLCFGKKIINVEDEPVQYCSAYQ